MSLADQIIDHGPYEPHQAVAWWDTAALNELRDELIAARATRTDGASQALAHIRQQLSAWSKLNGADARLTDGIVMDMLRTAAADLGVDGDAPTSPPASVIVWVCNRCNHTLSGNPRLCPHCGYTIYRPTREGR